MRVLEPGKNTEAWTIRHRCTGWGHGDFGCEALLEIERNDLMYSSGISESGLGAFQPAVSFECPCCGGLTDLGIIDWPPNYKNLKRLHVQKEKVHIG